MNLRLICLVSLFAGAAHADDWLSLAGPDITNALLARSVVYDTGVQQAFLGAGVTTADSGDDLSAGAWKVEGDRYRAQMPPQYEWACYDVARSADGLDLRFTDDAGEAVVGRYVDLQ
jgi:hypothetical protein